jgi:hypothetical protein
MPDSGTTDMTMPSWAYEQLKLATYEPNTYCENEFGFGELSFVINGVDYAIPSHHWNEAIYYRDSDDIKCRQKVSPLDLLIEGHENLFIAGDTWMQLYYSVFDRTKN